MKTMAVVSFWAAPAPARSTLTQRQQKTIAVVKDARTLACNYDPSVCVDDGSCSTAGFCIGCTDENACNYEPNATVDNGTCDYLDECDVCGGDGILPGECDCDGNV